MVTGEITLSIDGAPLKLKLTVPAKPVKPLVMLPIFQKMANLFVDIGTQQAASRGEQISCRIGCAACCRQPIPLLEVEIYFIAQLVDTMPEPHRSTVRARFDAATAHFHKNGWYEAFNACKDETELKRLIRAYFSAHIACPFLENEACSIYNQRPVGCREYLMVSPSEHCSSGLEAHLHQLSIPLSVSPGLSKIGWSGNLGEKKFLPLAFALEWAEQHCEAFPEKTGQEWLAEFFADEDE